MKSYVRKISRAAVLLAVCLLGKQVVAGEPGLYAFENGLGFGTDAEEAAFLKKLGYVGVSQSKNTGESLAEQIAAYEKEGLSVRSVYLDASEKPAAPELFRPLAKKGGLIELTVRKMTPTSIDAVRKTVAAASAMDIRVALYPHHGFGVETVSDALKMAADVDDPNLGVMFNLCHFLKNEDPASLETVIGAAGPKLFAVSVSGADTGGNDWSALIKRLDQGDFPMKRLLDALDGISFTGQVSLQCYALKGGKKENLKASIAEWKRLQKGIGSNR